MATRTTGDQPDFDDEDLELADEAQEEAAKSGSSDEICPCALEVIQQAHDIISVGDPEICHHSGVHTGDPTLRRIHDFLVSQGAECLGMDDSLQDWSDIEKPIDDDED